MLWFLNSGLLWAAPLAGIPILLHLIFLRRARRVPFSDLRLLRIAYLRSFSTSRLRQWILMAIRCLILILLILAFARPVWHTAQALAGAGVSAPSEEAADVVLLADVSYSMGYRVEGKTRLELASAAGQKILKLLGTQDRATVLPFSNRLEGPAAAEPPHWAHDTAAASGMLRHLEPGNRTTDFLPSLKTAYDFLKQSHAKRKVIIVLSDNAAHGWRGAKPKQAVSSLPAYDPSVVLLGLAWPDRPDNAAMLSAELGEESPDHKQILSARTFLSGPTRPSWDMDAWQQNRRVDQRHLTVLPGEGAPVQFQIPPASGSSVWGYLELRKDALPIDDTFYYSFRVQRKPKALLVQGGPRSLEVGHGGYFLKKLFLDAHGSLLPYELDIADSIRFKSIRLEDYRAVVLIDFRTIPEEMGPVLERFVRAGGSLWLIPAKVDRPAAWSPLERILPARIGDLMDFSGGGYGLKADESQLPQPRSMPFAWRDFELQNVEVRQAYALAPNADAKIWFRDAQGRPLMVFGHYGAGQALVWSSSLDLSWTNLALKPVFAAWADICLSALTGYSSRREWRSVKIGEPIIRAWSAEEPAPSSILIRGPQGRQTTLRVADRRATYLPDAPGLYFLEGAPDRESEGPEVFAVNLDRSTKESDVTMTPRPPWNELRVETLRQDFLRALYGRELRTPILALILALLALEVLLANPLTLPSPRGRREGEGNPVILAVILLLALCVAPCRAQEGDKFVWTQLRYSGGSWDPYPNVYSEIVKFVSQVTSILTVPERKALALKDKDLYSTSFLVLAGREMPDSLDDEEISRLRGYLTSGGFLWIEDASGGEASPFDFWVRQTMRLVFPDSDLTPLGSGHVIYKTFFLMRSIGGRANISASLEGINWEGRTVVVYSRNDIFGALAKDALGKYLYPCDPGGEAQRLTARKLALNIVMYALTGNYKSDAVHQPYILQKMRLGLTP